MVEFALVSLVLMTIIFGVIEGGLLVRASNAISSAADDAARRGAVAAEDPLADWMILQQLQTRGAVEAADINFVAVYRANAGGGIPNEICRTGVAVEGVCNVYTRADLDLPATSFGCLTAALDDNWCPSERRDDGVVYLGVWVDASHRGLTGVFGGIDLIGTTALPLEGNVG